MSDIQRAIRRGVFAEEVEWPLVPAGTRVKEVFNSGWIVATPPAPRKDLRSILANLVAKIFPDRRP